MRQELLETIVSNFENAKCVRNLLVLFSSVTPRTILKVKDDIDKRFSVGVPVRDLKFYDELVVRTVYRKGIKDNDGFFRNNVLTRRIHYYQSGKIHMEDNYVDGVAEGKFIIWRKDGTKSSELNYFNNLLEGPGYNWWNNWKLRSVTIYSRGFFVENQDFEED